MWWEYVIVFALLAVAVGYVAWFVMRSFTGKCGCGSGACAHKQSEPGHAEDRTGLKVTRLVQVRPPDKQA